MSSQVLRQAFNQLFLNSFVKNSFFFTLFFSCRPFGFNGISPIDGAEDKQKHEAIARWLSETQLTLA